MKTSNEFRQNAWNILGRDYWNPFLVLLVFSLIMGVSSSTFTFRLNGNESNAWHILVVFAAIFGSLLTIAVTIFVGGPLTFGKNKYFLHAADDKSRDFWLMFKDFGQNYGKKIALQMLLMLYIFLWSLLFIIPGIIKALSYSQAFNIMVENEELSAKECIARSEKMMDGQKWNLFALNFSFIGWYLLAILTFGIGLIFLAPYPQMANTLFYRELAPISRANGAVDTKLAN